MNLLMIGIMLLLAVIALFFVAYGYGYERGCRDTEEYHAIELSGILEEVK